MIGGAIGDPKITAVLKRMHAAASGQKFKIVRNLAPLFARQLLKTRGPIGWDELSRRAKDLYLPLSPEQGDFCYLTARAIGARRIVEFGTSFGISTIYFAAAIRDNCRGEGGGLVIGTEMVADKVAQARENLNEAGLAEFAEIREGDALVTLAKDLEGPIDMILLDGWKDGYMPVIRLLAPLLRAGGVVLADNIFTFKRDLRPYVEHMQDPANGFRSSTLHLGDGLEYSVKLPSPA